MNKTIEIKTTDQGFALYEQTAKSLKVHYGHLKQIHVHKQQIEVLNRMFPDSSEFANYKDLHMILEYNALLNIASLDLAIVARQLYITNDDWEKLFYGKHGYTLIYEAIERYKIQNKLIRDLINQKVPQLTDEYILITAELKAFKKSNGYESTIKLVRQRVGAQIDEFDSYFKTLSSIDSLQVLIAVKEFILILNKLQNLSTALINACGVESQNKFDNVIASMNSLKAKLGL